MAAPFHEAGIVTSSEQFRAAEGVSNPDIQRLFAERNVEAKSGTPEDLERIIKDEMTQWGEVVKRSNIKAD